MGEGFFLRRLVCLNPVFQIAMSKYRASGIHFVISLFVGLVLLALCWFVWYPAPMLLAIGGHEIFLLIVGIDVVIGERVDRVHERNRNTTRVACQAGSMRRP